MVFEIAGLVLSGIGLLNDRRNTYRDIKFWSEQDLEVDREWLALAIAKGLLAASEQDYTWCRLDKVPTRELKGTHQVVVALNEEERILYRIMQGPVGNRVVLTKKQRPDRQIIR